MKMLAFRVLPLAIVCAALSCTLSSAKGTEGQIAFDFPVSLTSKVITLEVSAYVRDVLAEASIPGLSMGIVRLDRSSNPIVELAAWGKGTEDGDGDDLTPDALFAMASCSKAFLVTSVGLLMEDFALARNVTSLPSGHSRLHWDTRIRDLLPDEWGFADDWTESKLTLRDAFSHASGLPRHDYSYRPGDSAADILSRLKHIPPAFELREQWMYNNQMFMVGAHIVSKFSGIPYQSFVSARIFRLLNMTHTTFSPSEAARTGKLTQTWTRGTRRIPFWFPEEVAELFAGAGGIISNAEDMMKWLTTLLNGGVDPRTNTTVIPSSVLTEMTTARTVVSGVPAGDVSIIGYGMGWFRMSYRGHDVLWHFGALPGFSLLVAFLPADNLGTVILANMDEKQDDNMRVLFRVIDEALGLPRGQISVHNADPPWSLRRLLGISTNHSRRFISGDVSMVTTGPPDIDIDAYAGTYASVAYGNITFCTASSKSRYCAHVLESFAPVENATNTSSRHALYAAWPRVWSTHVRLQHTSGDAFAVKFPALFPRGYGRNETPFEFYDSRISVGRAEFVVEDEAVVGFALVTDEQAAMARARRVGGSIRKIGDAWFSKVSS